MNNNHSFDKKISNLVRKIDKEIPPAIDNKIQMKMRALSEPPKKQIFKNPVFIWFANATAILLIFLLFYSPFLHKQSESSIPEIRMEFEIPDKNIKILFIQNSKYSPFKEDQK